MLLKSIKLKNIRSYKDEEIKFPPGSLLLSGDIGAGKSTILLAIEFCLFGFRPKVLFGSTLLRHGKKQGHVELAFELDNKEVIIRRTLKRGSRAIQQASGHIIRNSRKKELTPVELKAEIIDILGYPKSILSRSKDLMFRYTVYTPQEEMKRIITEEPETRLDVLRKVFNMDKYRRIRENASTYLRKLKDRSRVLEGKSDGLEELRQQKKERIKDIEDMQIRINAKKPEHEAARKNLADRKKDVDEKEKQVRKLAELKHELEKHDMSIKWKVGQRQENAREIERLSGIIEKEDVPEPDEDKEKRINARIRELEKARAEKESELNSINRKIAEFSVNRKNAEEIRHKIMSLDQCPTCEQDVSSEYKKAVVSRENSKIAKNNEWISEARRNLEKTQEDIDAMRKENEKLNKAVSEIELMKVRIKQLKQNIRQKQDLEHSQIKIRKDIGSINQKKMEIQKQISGMPDVEKIYADSKKKHDEVLAHERKLALEINSLDKEKEGLEKLLESHEKEIKQKSIALEKLKSNRQRIQWLEEYFIPLVSIIEKHVLSSIHREFDSHFREWFNILIEDENLNVTLDDQFTPVVSQNGYDASVENLSGGEKTSIALSYRLALNRVINDLIPTIRTGDIIILDEPTDGFSSNQLDKVRDVLDQLTNRQIIIVSHESKIESFVDSVIRIAKTEHVSRTY